MIEAQCCKSNIIVLRCRAQYNCLPQKGYRFGSVLDRFGCLRGEAQDIRIRLIRCEQRFESLQSVFILLIRDLDDG